MIAPARAGFAPPAYVHKEPTPAVSSHCPPALALEKQVLPVLRHWLIPRGCLTMPQAQGAGRVWPNCPLCAGAGELGAFLQGYSSVSLPPLTFPQPGLRMAKLSPVLESSFTLTEMVFLPLHKATRWMLNSQPGPFCPRPRCDGKMPSAASLHFIQLQASLLQPALPWDHLSFLGKVTISVTMQGLGHLVFPRLCCSRN